MLRLSAKRQRWAIRLGSVLVLLLAVMPQVLYLGHPLTAGEPPAQAGQTGHEHHDKVAAEHANHCHVGPKSCASSDGAAQVAPWSDAVYAAPDDSRFQALDSAEPLHTFAVYQRPEKPPRTA